MKNKIILGSVIVALIACGPTAWSLVQSLQHTAAQIDQANRMVETMANQIDQAKDLFPWIVGGVLVLVLALVLRRGAGAMVGGAMKVIEIGILVIVLIVALTILPEVQPTMEAFSARQAAQATASALDNDAKALAINQRATAAAGEANATATAVANSAIATTQAISISVEATRAANVYQANATAFAQQIIVTATLVAVPYLGRTAENDAWNNQTRNSVLTLAFLGGTIVVLLLVAAVAAVVRKESQTLHRDETGQLPARIQDGQIVNPGTAVVPVVGRPVAPWWMIPLMVIDYFRTGKMPTSAPTVGNEVITDPAQLLEAMRITIMPTTAAATFRPGQGEYEREMRIKNAQQMAGTRLLNEPPPMKTQIISTDQNGASTIGVMLGMVRDRILAMGPPPPSQTIDHDPTADDQALLNAPVEHSELDHSAFQQPAPNVAGPVTQPGQSEP